MKKNIENKGLENLPKYSPKDYIWDKIEEQLDKSKKRRFGWYTLSGIAASVLIAFFIIQTILTGALHQETAYEPRLIEPVPQTITESGVSELEYQTTPFEIEVKEAEPVIEPVQGLAVENVVKTNILDQSITGSPPIVNTMTNNDIVTLNFRDQASYMAAAPQASYTWSAPAGVDDLSQNITEYSFNTTTSGAKSNGTPLDFKGSQGLINSDPAGQVFSEDRKDMFGDLNTSIDADKDGDDGYFDADGFTHDLNGNRDYRGKKKTLPNTDYNQESYAKQVENEFMSPFKELLSTFAIDVDNASYAIMRTKINHSQIVPQNSVCIEEYINYFSYDYQSPVKNPFSVENEMAKCPWNTERRLLHIGLQGKKIDYENTEASNLVFLLDVSGSMGEENKLPLVKKPMNLLVEQMGEKDKIAIVTYAGAAGLALESTSCDKKEYIAKKIKNLESGGSTAGGQGIKLAYSVALDNLVKDGNNRIILCTDGDFNVGESSDGAMEDLIVSYRDKGVFITVCGFGMGNYQDSKMETIADNGNGNYFYIDNFREADKVFNRELRATLFTIAKDVKIQVEFNPAYVKAYRLIGYENRIMPAQDFNDDTKDGGELGAGHTVTAVYEIIPASSQENFEEVDPLKYQRVEKTENLIYNDEAVTLKLRYKEPKETVSKLLTYTVKPGNSEYQGASENFRFSAGVALFASSLRQSKFTNDPNFEKALDLVKNASSTDPNEDRAQLIELMNRAQTLYGNVSER